MRWPQPNTMRELIPLRAVVLKQVARSVTIRSFLCSSLFSSYYFSYTNLIVLLFLAPDLNNASFIVKPEREYKMASTINR